MVRAELQRRRIGDQASRDAFLATVVDTLGVFFVMTAEGPGPSVREIRDQLAEIETAAARLGRAVAAAKPIAVDSLELAIGGNSQLAAAIDAAGRLNAAAVRAVGPFRRSPKGKGFDPRRGLIARLASAWEWHFGSRPSTDREGQFYAIVVALFDAVPALGRMPSESVLRRILKPHPHQ